MVDVARRPPAEEQKPPLKLVPEDKSRPEVKIPSFDLGDHGRPVREGEDVGRGRVEQGDRAVSNEALELAGVERGIPKVDIERAQQTSLEEGIQEMKVVGYNSTQEMSPHRPESGFKGDIQSLYRNAASNEKQASPLSFSFGQFMSTVEKVKDYRQARINKKEKGFLGRIKGFFGRKNKSEAGDIRAAEERMAAYANELAPRAELNGERMATGEVMLAIKEYMDQN